MTEQVRYRVKRQFKYKDRLYKSGELWEPAGARNDAAIIRSGLVHLERVEAPARRKVKADGAKG